MKSGVQGKLRELCKLDTFKNLREKNLVFHTCERCEAIHGYLGNTTGIPTVPLSVYPTPKIPRQL